MNALLDEIGDTESHLLAGLLDAVTMFARDYTEREAEIPEANPAAVAFPDGRAWCENRKCGCRRGTHAQREAIRSLEASRSKRSSNSMRKKLDAMNQSLPLAAGMSVHAEIIQDERTVLEYLLSPVQRVVSEAGRER